jgi:hypothetical protein
MATKKTAAKPAAKTVKADGQNQMNTAAAEQAEETNTTQAGMEQGPSPKEQRAKINAAFEKADEKGRQAIIDETQAGIGVRGY